MVCARVEDSGGRYTPHAPLRLSISLVQILNYSFSSLRVDILVPPPSRVAFTFFLLQTPVSTTTASSGRERCLPLKRLDNLLPSVGSLLLLSVFLWQARHLISLTLDADRSIHEQELCLSYNPPTELLGTAGEETIDGGGVDGFSEGATTTFRSGSSEKDNRYHHTRRGTPGQTDRARQTDRTRWIDG